MTCIVINRLNDRIVVGSDSKRTIYEMNAVTLQHEELIENNYKKIHRVGNQYFAIAGFDDGKQLEEAINACLSSTDMGIVCRKFALTMSDIFESSLEDIRKKNKALFHSRFGKDGIIAKSAFFRMNGPVPELRVITFLLASKPHQKCVVQAGYQDDRTMVFLGTSSGIAALSEVEKAELQRLDPVEMIKKLINIEIIASPEMVGDPVVGIILSAGGEQQF